MPDRPRMPQVGLTPADVAEMPAEAMPGLLVELGALQGAALARLAAIPSRNGEASLPPKPEPGRNGDSWLTSEQVAQRLGRDKRWVWRRARSWDFTVKHGNSLSFSERGLAEYMERHRLQDGH